MSSPTSRKRPWARLNVLLTAAVLGMGMVAADPASVAAEPWASSSTPYDSIPDGAYDGTRESMSADSIVSTTIPLGRAVTHIFLSVAINHSRIGDLTIKLRGPTGIVMTVLNRPGSDAPDNGTDSPLGDDSSLTATAPIMFYDEAVPSAETLGVGLGPDQAPCDWDVVCAYHPAPDTAVSRLATLADAFSTGLPSGLWTLHVGDSVAGETGTVVAWGLTIEHVAVSSFPASSIDAIPDDTYDGSLASMASSSATAYVAVDRVITDITVTIGIGHSRAGDLTIKLESPAGSLLTLVNRPGSDADDDGGGTVGNSADLTLFPWLRFSDRFSVEAEELGSGLTTDQVVCAQDGLCSVKPSPDGAAGLSSFAGFNGEAALGEWTLYVGDSSPGDVGTQVRWSIAFETLSSLTACSNQPFVDVPVEHSFCPEIGWMAENSISTGWEDGTYRPALDVTRQAMSAFMARLANVVPPDCETAPFLDVPVEHPFCREIRWMKDNGISMGFDDGTYRPGEPVSRQAMSAFIARLSGASPSACSRAPFTDVPTSHPFCPEIMWMRSEGISTGFADATYRGNDDVTRQAMSAFMYRASFVDSVAD